MRNFSCVEQSKFQSTLNLSMALNAYGLKINIMVSYKNG